MKVCLLFSVFLSVAVSQNVGRAQGIAPWYSVTPIFVSDANYVAGEAVNSLGMVAVGAYEGADVPQAFRLNGGLASLSGLASGGAYANSINDAGLTVGWSFNSAGLRQPVAWQDATAQHLGSLGGDRGEARGVNNQGMIVGQSRNASGQARAFAYTSSLGMTELPMTLGGTRSSANAISDSGFVAGSGRTVSEDSHAVRFHVDTSELIGLGTLGGSNSFANGVNLYGHVVGLSDTVDDFRPFFWTPELGMLDIFAGGDLGASFGAAYEVNRFGVVVGYGEINDNFDSHAFAWSIDQGLVNLNDRLLHPNGIELFGAAGINDVGQIVGWGSVNGLRAGFLLSPVPEPSSLMLLLGALSGSIGWRFRARNEL
jgi:probable HAF family extracellular repeat protein